jgi:membrane fusion protein, copper/silver efflux system
VEIKSGLASSDEIAENAQYLIDSESFIKTAK